MVEESIIMSVKKYLTELINLGIPVQYGILFGSCIQESGSDRWSDIDLLVISSLYDDEYSREDINLLWKIAARTDNRIEPVPVGLKRWQTDDESTIIEVARREGIEIAA
jgi:predicted nucleotidyltransferase